MHTPNEHTPGAFREKTATASDQRGVCRVDRSGHGRHQDGLGAEANDRGQGREPGILSAA